jgi:lipopolysaccharide/colanic/teichoic acid biosynthesis glycosyltransferase
MTPPASPHPGADRESDALQGSVDEVIRIPDLVAPDRGVSPLTLGTRLETQPLDTHQEAGRLYLACKRAFDVFLVVVLSPVWLALYGAIAVAILISDGRPIHYKDRRVGKDGRELVVVKFRTMHSDADEKLEGLLDSKPALRAEFSRFSKLRSDPRVTRLGRQLRRSSLDELPQLFGILTGSMSLVGPRPLTRSEIERFYKGPARRVLSVRPGLTGLWQIRGRSSLTLEERVPLDVQYVRERSFWRDIVILFKTVPLVLRGHEAV